MHSNLVSLLTTVTLIHKAYRDLLEAASFFVFFEFNWRINSICVDLYWKKKIYMYITFIKAQVSNVWNLRVLHFW